MEKGGLKLTDEHYEKMGTLSKVSSAFLNLFTHIRKANSMSLLSPSPSAAPRSPSVMSLLDFSNEIEESLLTPLTDISEVATSPSSAAEKSPLPAPSLLGKSNSFRERRPSVAVWADDKLMAFLSKQNSIQSNLTATSTMTRRTRVDGSTEMLSPSSPVHSQLGKLNRLGEPLIKRIFSFINLRTLMKMRLVNGTFQELLESARDGGLFDHTLEHIDLSAFNKRITNENCLTVFRFCSSRVKTLNLKNCWSLSDTFFAIIASYMSELRVLNLSSVWDLTDDGIQLLTHQTPKLQSIDLSNCKKMTDAGLREILNNCPEIKEIYISYCKNITDATFDHPRWEQITKANFQRCTAIRDSAFGKWLKQGKNFAMKYLILSDCSFLTDDTIRCIVPTCPNLEVLSLSFCCAMSEAVVPIIGSLKNLRILDLSFCGNAVTDSALSTLTNAKCAQRLSHLYIRGCVQITNESLITLSSLPSLKSWNISQCRNITQSDFKSGKIECVLESKYDL